MKYFKLWGLLLLPLVVFRLDDVASQPAVTSVLTDSEPFALETAGRADLVINVPNSPLTPKLLFLTISACTKATFSASIGFSGPPGESNGETSIISPSYLVNTTINIKSISVSGSSKTLFIAVQPFSTAVQIEVYVSTKSTYST